MTLCVFLSFQNSSEQIRSMLQNRLIGINLQLNFQSFHTNTGFYILEEIVFLAEVKKRHKFK